MKNGRHHQSTPPGIYGFANERWGPFTLDAAASEWNAKCPRFFSEADNALSPESEWTGRVWCNPPWESKPGILPFVERAVESVFVVESAELVVMLLPTRTGSAWYLDLAERYARIVPIRGRVKFDPPPGAKKGKGGFEDVAYFVFERPLVVSGGDLPVKTWSSMIRSGAVA